VLYMQYYIISYWLRRRTTFYNCAEHIIILYCNYYTIRSWLAWAHRVPLTYNERFKKILSNIVDFRCRCVYSWYVMIIIGRRANKPRETRRKPTSASYCFHRFIDIIIIIIILRLWCIHFFYEIIIHLHLQHV